MSAATKTYTFLGQSYTVPASMTIDDVRAMIANVSEDIWDATFVPNDEGGTFTVQSGTKG